VSDELSLKAEKAARKAEKAVKRARKALKKYINGDEDLAELVSGCYEGYPASDMERGARNMRELGNTLMFIRGMPYDHKPPLEIPEDRPHVGHFSRLGGTWFCDTCNSPLCELA
jgi:hypothetical protein